MSRRPVLKVLLPFISGAMVNPAIWDPVSVPVLVAFCLLMFFPVVLCLRRSWNMLSDTFLLFQVFLSGLAAGRCDDAHKIPPLPPVDSPITVLFLSTGFCERVGEDVIKVEGMLLQVEEGEELSFCRQPILSYLEGGPGNPGPGDLIAANGRLSLPDRGKNPGGMSRKESLDRRGLTWIFRSEGEWHIVHFEGTGGPGTPVGIRLRKTIGSSIDRLFPGEDAGLLKGILLGARGSIAEDRKIAFSRAGIYHILAISGLHVGIISGTLLVLFSILRLPPVARILALAPVLLLYGSATGMKPSIQRATVMLISVTLAASLQKKVDLVNILYAVAMLLIFCSPSAIQDTGFQMSFLATWGILSLYPGFKRLIDRLPGGCFPVVGWVLRVLAVSTCAQVPLVPVIASSFHMVSVVSPLANLVALPVMGILLPAGLLSVVTHPVSPFLSESFSEVASLLIAVLFGLSDVISGLSIAAVRVSPFGPLWIAAYYFLLFFLAQAAESRIGWGTLLVMTLLVCNVGVFAGIIRSAPPMRVTFLDVGQGDSAVFEFPTGEVLVMDGGPLKGEWDPGERVLEPFLLESGIDNVSILAFSHPQMDHIGGLLYLLDRYDVRAVLEPGHPTTLSHYSVILQKSLEKKARLYFPRRGDSISIGEARILFLHPTEEWIGGAPGQDDVNESSVVARIDYGEISFLMTGDIGYRVEEELVARAGDDLDVDVLKVAHHGSRMSSTDPFLDAADPMVAVISVGRYNTFGHPSSSLLERLAERDIEVLRTDTHGALVFVVENNRFDVFDGSNERIWTYGSPGRMANVTSD